MPRFEDDNLNLPEEDYVPMGGASDDDSDEDKDKEDENDADEKEDDSDEEAGE